MLIAKKWVLTKFFPAIRANVCKETRQSHFEYLSGMGTSAYKFSNDLRLLQHLKEIEEPFEDKQIGSSVWRIKETP